MPTESERTKILEMIADGTISAEDGVKLLDALDDASKVSSIQEAYLPEAPTNPEIALYSLTGALRRNSR